ncbi:putative retinoic acid induced 16-like protein [Plasmopara halstedii]
MSWLRSKLRQVAARASDALAQAADMVAPTLYESRVDEFQHRWTTVARFLESVLSRDLEPAEQRRLLLESHTRDSLLKLVLLIYEEENNSDRWELVMARPKAAAEDAANVESRTRSRSRAQSQTPLSPERLEHASHECLEYLLEKQIIPHLCEVGRRDQPCGIMSLAMQFVGALLSRVSYPILPTREVHVAVVALIQAAARKEVEDPTVRKYLISLLNILWKKLRGDPVQTEFFFLHADRLMIRRTDMASNTNNSSNRLESSSDDPFLHHHNHHTQSEVPELILFTGLLPHMYAVGKIGEKCREALVIAAAVHDKALCRFVLQLTPFCHYAVNGVISAFDALPKTLASTSKSSVSVSSTDADATMELDLSFLAVRLRFCCTLAMVARYELEEVDEVTGDLQHHSIADELLDQFRTRFLEGPLVEGLLHTSEAAACAATLYARIILEELTACGRDTRANPLLLIYLQFLLERAPVVRRFNSLITEHAAAEPETPIGESSAAQQLPFELLRHMDSLSSSLCIATIELFTCVLELQDEYADSILLGNINKCEKNADTDGGTTSGKQQLTRSIVQSPTTPANDAIWFASRFPDSSVASNVHLWKIRAFAGPEDVPEDFPAADDQEDQVLSLLSYIADAEYAACQQGPEELSDVDDETGDSQEELAATQTTVVAPSVTDSLSQSPATFAPNAASPSKGSFSRTSATRHPMKPLRDVYLSICLPSFSPAEPVGHRQRSQPQVLQRSIDESNDECMPLFLRIALNRVERLLENSFQENVALSGLIYALAQKPLCSNVIFDLDDAYPAGHSLRSILEEVFADALRRLNRLPNGTAQLQEVRKKLVDEDNLALLDDHEAETRLFAGYVLLDEILKELCSLLFARERVKSLPVKPEGYYLEPNRAGSLSPTLDIQRKRALSSETLFSDEGSQIDAASPSQQRSIGKEFEAMLAEAQSSMDDLLVGPEDVLEASTLEAELATQIV